MDLDGVVTIGRRSQFLVIASTSRADGTIASALVNAGVLAHPLTGERIVGLVSQPGVRVRNLRARPHATVSFRADWSYATVEGTAELAGPDDPLPGIDDERLRLLLREIFTAAGGTHDDWDEYDRVMAADRRCAVLLTPTRIYGT